MNWKLIEIEGECAASHCRRLRTARPMGKCGPDGRARWAGQRTGQMGTGQMGTGQVSTGQMGARWGQAKFLAR